MILSLRFIKGSFVHNTCTFILSSVDNNFFHRFFQKNINGDGAGGKEITKDGGSVDSEVLFFVELDSSEGISDS